MQSIQFTNNDHPLDALRCCNTSLLQLQIPCSRVFVCASRKAAQVNLHLLRPLSEPDDEFRDESFD
jgi:hypothetical protein